MLSIILYRLISLSTLVAQADDQVGTNSRDEPMKDAMAFRIPVEREDIVVLGSDGLIDNLVSCPALSSE
jgi:putative cell wall-binding protein